MPTRTVSFANILRSALALAPELPQMTTGLVKLVSLHPERRLSIGRLLEKQAQRYGKRPFLKYQEKTWSYDAANRQVNRFSHALAQANIQPGDRVAILMENRPETLLATLAILKLGAIATMLNTSQRNNALLHSLTITKPTVCIVGEELTEVFDDIKHKLSETQGQSHFFVNDNSTTHTPDGYQNLAEVSEDMPDTNPDITRTLKLSSPALYIFTSGTTGLPKASVMSHFRWFKAMAGIGMMSLRLKPTDILYCALPLYHNNALTVSLSAVMGNGASLAIARKFSVNRFWDDIRHYGATSFCYIGEFCRYLLNHPTRPNDADNPVRTIIGNGLRPDIWETFKERFRILSISEFYGASEVNLVFTNALNLDKTAGTCPMAYEVVRYDVQNDCPVRTSNGFMEKVNKGESGLLLTKVTRRMPFDGYTDKDASQKKLYRDVFRAGDCYINTGDLVVRQGWRHIAFSDRIGDTFRWKGENVATSEVEAAFTSFSAIEHAVTYGISLPGADGRAGMTALVVSETEENLNLEALTQHVCRQLPGYAIPLFLRICDSQQMTTTFKYQKTTLKKEGFDTSQFNDPVLALLPGNQHYQPLKTKDLEQIHAGKVRF
ncbi:long-chain-acyl-CoA synthetase [Kistimonas asteriae]|uniref:long-chain-acyl-CoA synthetase n=1 Tax=Kistimonas asteriae TaxID=517724 RepID=UPI001BA5CD5A|nr:long-chain-acyl-CoA synthetase [Kistimonas asteriae]